MFSAYLAKLSFGLQCRNGDSISGLCVELCDISGPFLVDIESIFLHILTSLIGVQNAFC